MATFRISHLSTLPIFLLILTQLTLLSNPLPIPLPLTLATIPLTSTSFTTLTYASEINTRLAGFVTDPSRTDIGVIGVLLERVLRLLRGWIRGTTVGLVEPKPVEDGEGEGHRGFDDPREGGGRMLDWAKQLGEPLNMIISNKSDPFVLTDAGLMAYARSLGFANECLNIHLGKRHLANLGDGQGRVIQRHIFREEFVPSWWGSCLESLFGGNHFRAWKQKGSGAWFLAVSSEHNAFRSHLIIPDGYNIGRDDLLQRALVPNGTKWRGMRWITEVEWDEPRSPSRDNSTTTSFVRDADAEEERENDDEEVELVTEGSGEQQSPFGLPTPARPKPQPPVEDPNSGRSKPKPKIDRGSLQKPGSWNINHAIPQDGRVAIVTIRRVE